METLTSTERKVFDEGMAIVSRKLAGFREAQELKKAKRDRDMAHHFQCCSNGGRTVAEKNGRRIFRTFTALRESDKTHIFYVQ